uniref:Uncharacterized protein n=1 Tax=Chromera velia CCMP2878 TaxID=1169474 RepID=A0A0G4HBZ8_9ALVE|eukprot:Cvel_25931.t1-p1 / transcript=Cvel_25931.t1 / gene=Cvel_25931 / organism=Chromera_velia_CCMP2878 / gene_product=hypothetical protein / transcript_product=hypothetical protein / location=Cvel_scaffold3001:7415-17527(+) / protein_length=2212 / sequence_SO=supercontig / SO=protein_coding / is_pseudo=false
MQIVSSSSSSSSSCPNSVNVGGIPVVFTDHELCIFRTKACDRFMAGKCTWQEKLYRPQLCQFLFPSPSSSSSSSSEEDEGHPAWALGRNKRHKKQQRQRQRNKQKGERSRERIPKPRRPVTDCPFRHACPFAHSREEQMYHPLMYKQVLCEIHRQRPGSCVRTYCPLAHSAEETAERVKTTVVDLKSPSFLFPIGGHQSNQQGAHAPNPSGGGDGGLDSEGGSATVRVLTSGGVGGAYPPPEGILLLSLRRRSKKKGAEQNAQAVMAAAQTCALPPLYTGADEADAHMVQRWAEKRRQGRERAALSRLSGASASSAKTAAQEKPVFLEKRLLSCGRPPSAECSPGRAAWGGACSPYSFELSEPRTGQQREFENETLAVTFGSARQRLQQGQVTPVASTCQRLLPTSLPLPPTEHRWNRTGAERESPPHRTKDTTRTSEGQEGEVASSKTDRRETETVPDLSSDLDLDFLTNQRDRLLSAESLSPTRSKIEDPDIPPPPLPLPSFSHFPLANSSSSSRNGNRNTHLIVPDWTALPLPSSPSPPTSAEPHLPPHQNFGHRGEGGGGVPLPGGWGLPPLPHPPGPWGVAAATQPSASSGVSSYVAAPIVPLPFSQRAPAMFFPFSQRAPAFPYQSLQRAPVSLAPSRVPSEQTVVPGAPPSRPLSGVHPHAAAPVLEGDHAGVAMGEEEGSAETERESQETAAPIESLSENVSAVLSPPQAVSDERERNGGSQGVQLEERERERERRGQQDPPHGFIQQRPHRLPFLSSDSLPSSTPSQFRLPVLPVGGEAVGGCRGIMDPGENRSTRSTISQQQNQSLRAGMETRSHELRHPFFPLPVPPVHSNEPSTEAFYSPSPSAPAPSVSWEGNPVSAASSFTGALSSREAFGTEGERTAALQPSGGTRPPFPSPSASPRVPSDKSVHVNRITAERRRMPSRGQQLTNTATRAREEEGGSRETPLPPLPRPLPPRPTALETAVAETVQETDSVSGDTPGLCRGGVGADAVSATASTHPGTGTGRASGNGLSFSCVEWGGSREVQRHNESSSPPPRFPHDVPGSAIQSPSYRPPLPSGLPGLTAVRPPSHSPQLPSHPFTQETHRPTQQGRPPYPSEEREKSGQQSSRLHRSLPNAEHSPARGLTSEKSLWASSNSHLVESLSLSGSPAPPQIQGGGAILQQQQQQHVEQEEEEGGIGVWGPGSILISSALPSREADPISVSASASSMGISPVETEVVETHSRSLPFRAQIPPQDHRQGAKKTGLACPPRASLCVVDVPLHDGALVACLADSLTRLVGVDAGSLLHRHLKKEVEQQSEPKCTLEGEQRPSSSSTPRKSRVRLATLPGLCGEMCSTHAPRVEAGIFPPIVNVTVRSHKAHGGGGYRFRTQVAAELDFSSFSPPCISSLRLLKNELPQNRPNNTVPPASSDLSLFAPWRDEWGLDEVLRHGMYLEGRQQAGGVVSLSPRDAALWLAGKGNGNPSECSEREGGGASLVEGLIGLLVALLKFLVELQARNKILAPLPKAPSFVLSLTKTEGGREMNDEGNPDAAADRGQGNKGGHGGKGVCGHVSLHFDPCSISAATVELWTAEAATGFCSSSSWSDPDDDSLDPPPGGEAQRERGRGRETVSWGISEETRRALVRQLRRRLLRPEGERESEVDPPTFPSVAEARGVDQESASVSVRSVRSSLCGCEWWSPALKTRVRLMKEMVEKGLPELRNGAAFSQCQQTQSGALGTRRGSNSGAAGPRRRLPYSSGGRSEMKQTELEEQCRLLYRRFNTWACVGLCRDVLCLSLASSEESGAEKMERGIAIPPDRSQVMLDEGHGKSSRAGKGSRGKETGEARQTVDEVTRSVLTWLPRGGFEESLWKHFLGTLLENEQQNEEARRQIVGGPHLVSSCVSAFTLLHHPIFWSASSSSTEAEDRPLNVLRGCVMTAGFWRDGEEGEEEKEEGSKGTETDQEESKWGQSAKERTPFRDTGKEEKVIEGRTKHVVEQEEESKKWYEMVISPQSTKWPDFKEHLCRIVLTSSSAHSVRSSFGSPFLSMSSLSVPLSLAWIVSVFESFLLSLPDEEGEPDSVEPCSFSSGEEGNPPPIGPHVNEAVSSSSTSNRGRGAEKETETEIEAGDHGDERGNGGLHLNTSPAERRTKREIRSAAPTGTPADDVCVPVRLNSHAMMHERRSSEASSLLMATREETPHLVLSLFDRFAYAMTSSLQPETADGF